MTCAPGWPPAASTSPRRRIWTSALATAKFLADQRPGGSAYVVGEAGLLTAMHDVGFVMTDRHPDYVVLGETRTYSFESITRAIRLIENGARFIATNPDPSGPSPFGTLPATGLGRRTHLDGDRTPALLRRQAEPAHDAQRAQPDRRPLGDDHHGRRPDGHRHHRGLEAGLRTVLVLTGSTRREQVETFPYRPSRIVDSVADLIRFVDHDHRATDTD